MEDADYMSAASLQKKETSTSSVFERDLAVDPIAVLKFSSISVFFSTEL